MTSLDYYNKLDEILDSGVEIKSTQGMYVYNTGYFIGDDIHVHVDTVSSINSRIHYKNIYIPLNETHLNYFVANLKTKLYNLEQDKTNKILQEFLNLKV